MKIKFELDLDTWDGDQITITRTESGGVLVEPVEPEADDFDDEDVSSADKMAKIKDRWARERADSGAFPLVDELQARGLNVEPPNTRKEGKKDEPYLRLVEKSKTGLTVAAFINTNSMIVNRQDLRPVVAELDGADVHSNGNVYFDVDELDTCLAAVDAMLAI